MLKIVESKKDESILLIASIKNNEYRNNFGKKNSADREVSQKYL